MNHSINNLLWTTLFTVLYISSVNVNVVMAGYLHPQYGFAHRVNNPHDIGPVVNKGINGIEFDVCRGHSRRHGWNWYVSHYDMNICNNIFTPMLKDWLQELKNQYTSDKPLAMLWIDIKTPGDASMGELVDDIHNAGLPSSIKILYDLVAFNAAGKAGFDRIYYKLNNANEGISFCAGHRTCGNDITLVKQIYDYYKSKNFTRGTFNTGDSIDIDENFIYYGNSPLFNDPTDPYRFKAVFTWTTGHSLQNNMKDYMTYTDGQSIGRWWSGWNSPNDEIYIDQFKSDVNSYYPQEILATSSDDPFTTYQRHSTYIILDTTSENWYDAKFACSDNHGGSLATLITNNQIQIANQLRINSEYSNTESLWIGLNKNTNNGEWQWDSQHMCIYTGNSNCNNDGHWNVGQPSDGAGEGCAVLLVDKAYDNSFDDIPCSTTMIGYLCDSPNEYILIQEAKTWQNAQDYCRNKYGTNLATAVNDNQIYKLMQMFGESEEMFWVGLNDRNTNTNGDWEWVSGYSCSYAPNGECEDDTHWDVNEPDGDGYDCAVLVTTGGKLHAASCTDVSYFFCDSSLLSSTWSPPSENDDLSSGTNDKTINNVDDIEYNDSNDDNIYKMLVVSIDEFTWINIWALCIFICLSGVVSVYYYSKRCS